MPYSLYDSFKIIGCGEKVTCKSVLFALFLAKGGGNSYPDP